MRALGRGLSIKNTCFFLRYKFDLSQHRGDFWPSIVLMLVRLVVPFLNVVGGLTGPFSFSYSSMRGLQIGFSAWHGPSTQHLDPDWSWQSRGLVMAVPGLPKLTLGHVKWAICRSEIWRYLDMIISIRFFNIGGKAKTSTPKDSS